MAAVRNWLGHPSTIAAIALVAMGLLVLGMLAQSPTRIYWTGAQVPGTVDGGLVYYRVAGEQYTVDDTGEAPADGTRVTVFVDEGDPTQALLDRPVRWIDAGAVVVWFVAAGALLAVAALRRSRTADRRHELERAVGW
jgi:hypothetical protein